MTLVDRQSIQPYLNVRRQVFNFLFCLYQSPIQFDTRKFSFTNRIISSWNSLSDSVVSANIVNTFKNRLDRFWKNQEIQFNWKADIDTGSRSKVNVILV